MLTQVCPVESQEWPPHEEVMGLPVRGPTGGISLSEPPATSSNSCLSDPTTDRACLTHRSLYADGFIYQKLGSNPCNNGFDGRVGVTIRSARMARVMPTYMLRRSRRSRSS